MNTKTRYLWGCCRSISLEDAPLPSVCGWRCWLWDTIARSFFTVKRSRSECHEVESTSLFSRAQLGIPNPVFASPSICHCLLRMYLLVPNYLMFVVICYLPKLNVIPFRLAVRGLHILSVALLTSAVEVVYVCEYRAYALSFSVWLAKWKHVTCFSSMKVPRWTWQRNILLI